MIYNIPDIIGFIKEEEVPNNLDGDKVVEKDDNMVFQSTLGKCDG